jgi:IclR family acetate operon transcriptional repressor
MAAKTSGRTAPGYPIESVNNAFRLLLMFREQPHLRLTEASAALGVAPSTAHRLLAMLEFHDFVRNDEHLRAYVAGQAFTDVGLSVVQRLSVRRLARPILQSLQRETNETAHLAMLAGNRVLYLDAVESSRGLRVGSRTGRSLPANCTSVGKALLAQLSDDEVRALFPHEDLPTQTHESLATRTDLLRELGRVREAHIAENHGESEVGVGSVGIAVPTLSGGRRIGISLAVPLIRSGDEVMASLADRLRHAVAELADLIDADEAARQPTT